MVTENNTKKTNEFTFDNNESKISKDLENKIYINNMVGMLRGQTHFITIKEWERKSIYRYEDGIFIRDGDTYIKEILRDHSQFIMPETMNTITKLLQAETYISMKDLDKDMNHIVTLNKIVNILTGEIKDFSPEYFATSRIPVVYNPEADCKLFKKFLSEILYPEDIPVVFELIGYCLFKTNIFKKIFYLYGENDSGKTTLLDFIKTFLGGNDVVSAETIQHLGNPMTEMRSTATLFGKLANLCGETPTTPIKETAKLKQLSSTDLVEGDEKFGNKLRFVNYSKLIFASNHMISFPEEEEYEIMSRMKFITFPFSIPIEKQDKNLLNKLTSSEELSGVLNLAIKGLQNMILNGEMSNYKTKDQNLEIYNSFGNSVKKFVNERIERNAIGYITHPDLEAEYLKFCQENKLAKLSNKKFFELFKLAINFTEDNKFTPNINGQRVRAISGIVWKIIIDKNEICQKGNAGNEGTLHMLRGKNIEENKNLAKPTYGCVLALPDVPKNSDIDTEFEQEPDFETDDEKYWSKKAFEHLDEIEEIAEKMFAQEYSDIEIPEENIVTEEIKVCIKCKETFVSEKGDICQKCLEIMNAPKQKCDKGHILENGKCYYCERNEEYLKNNKKR